MDALVAIVALLALLFYFYTCLNVGRTRGATKIHAPAMTGHPQLERAVRVQANTLEWLPIFLVSLFLFDLFIPKPYGAWIGAAAGLVWIAGRFMYLTGYMADPAKRSAGFAVQGLSCGVLLFGALGGAVWALVAHGA
jgi:glutathione S-transferase